MVQYAASCFTIGQIASERPFAAVAECNACTYIHVHTHTHTQIPKALIKSLPFASKPKDEKKRRKPTYLAKRAVVMEPEERKLHTLMQRVATIRNDKTEKRKEMQELRKKKLQKKIAKNEEGRVQVPLAAPSVCLSLCLSLLFVESVRLYLLLHVWVCVGWVGGWVGCGTRGCFC
jgi:hypothetical protein